MPQIFISYSRDERAVAEALAGLLAAEGYDVWWDASLLSGAHFEDEINTALRAAPAAIILWSKTAVQSEWVRAEAEIARKLRTAMPVVIDDVDLDTLPMLYQQLHVIDLKHWTGDAAAKGFRELLAAVGKRLSQPPKSGADPAAPEPDRKKPATTGLARLPLVVAGLASLALVIAVAIFALNLATRPIDDGPSIEDAPISEPSISEAESSEQVSSEQPSSEPKPLPPFWSEPSSGPPIVDVSSVAPPIDDLPAIAECAPTASLLDLGARGSLCLPAGWSRTSPPFAATIEVSTALNREWLRIDTSPAMQPSTTIQSLLKSVILPAHPESKGAAELVASNTELINGRNWSVWDFRTPGPVLPNYYRIYSHSEIGDGSLRLEFRASGGKFSAAIADIVASVAFP